MATDTKLQLLQLCRDGNLPSLKDLITNQGLNPNEVKDSSGLTLLHLACQHGHLDIVQYLINDQNCNPETTTTNGHTPLHTACKSGHLHIIKCLISDHKCNPHCTDNDGCTPLHAASESGNIETVEYLITEQGCDPHVGDSIGNAPLHYASKGGHLDVVQCLITEFNSDPQIPIASNSGPQQIDLMHIFDCNCSAEYSSENGNTPLHSACQNGHLEVAKYLITEHKCNPEHGNINGYTPLHSAACNGHLAVVKYLISKLDCNPKISTDDGHTALHYSCLNGHLDVTRYLILDCNCNPGCLTNRGFFPLHHACKNGHLEVAKYLITEYKCSPEHGNVDGYTSLHSAAGNGHLAVVKYLINELGCNPQIADNNDTHPLHYACLNGHIDITEYLVFECKCNPRCIEKHGYNPFHCACQNDDLEFLKYLISEYKYSLEQGANDGCRPLHIASLNGHLAVVKYFISELGCNPQIADNNGYTPLHYACHNGYLDITKYLISDCNFNPQCSDKNGITPLHCACHNGHLEVTKYLITEHKCSPEHGNVNGYTPLHSAASNGHLAVVKYLVDEHGCNPQIVSNGGFVPLHYACHNGHLDITKYLISDCNCNPQWSASNGDTPLHCACQNGHLGVAKYLITEHKCSPEHGNVNGYTPLHSAASSGHLAVVKYLISELGCNPQITESNDGLTPLHYACLNGHLDITKYFISECNCDPKCLTKGGYPLLHSACQNGHLEIAKYLIIEHKCSPEHGNVTCFTPLHVAALNGHLAVVKYLISELGCDPQIATNEGLTPLHYACLNGHLDITKYLISDCNCNPQCSTNSGFTPLHCACENGHYEIVEYLITHCNCNPQCCDNKGITPLHAACGSGHLHVANYLIQEQNCASEPEANQSLFNINGLTPLHYASSNGHLDVTKYLISDCNCNPQCSTNSGFTPLHCACEKGHYEVAEYLITQCNCNAQCRDINGFTPLHAACEGGHLHVVKYLIQEQNCACDPEANQPLLNVYSITPLHAASERGHLKIVKYLISVCKCNPNQSTGNGFTAIDFAQFGGHEEVVSYLKNEHQCSKSLHQFFIRQIPNFSGASCDHSQVDFNDMSMSPLHQACLTGNLEAVKLCITKSDSNSSFAVLGITPLHFCCAMGHLEIAKYLIAEHKYSPQVGSVSGFTSLHFAVLCGHLSVVKYFISELGCNPQIEDINGFTPLHCACWNGHFEIAKYLIYEYKCSPECANMNGYTPLHSAASNGHLAVVKYLITQCSCNPQCSDNNGITPLHEACYKGHLHVAKYLTQEQHYEPKAKIPSNMIKKQFGFTDTYLKVHGPIADVDGITPLHFACMEGYLDIVRYLISVCNCDPHHSTSNGRTAIDFAQFGRHHEVVRYLRNEHQCHVNLVQVNLSGPLLNVGCFNYDDILISPLGKACLTGDLAAVKFHTTRSNYNPSSAVYLGLTPVHVACMTGRLEIAKHLVTVCGFDPNCVFICRHGTMLTPASIATIYGQLEAVKWLVNEQKCDPVYRGKCLISQYEYNMPLVIPACMLGHLSVMKFLLSESSSQNFVKPYLPIFASRFGQLNILKYLIDECKCNPTFTAIDGSTPLHHACGGIQNLVCRISATRTTKNVQELNLMQILHVIIVTLLVNVLPKTITKFFHSADEQPNYDITSDINTKSADHDNRSIKEQLTAYNNSCLDVVKYLITEHNCNPQCTDKEGLTPLHYACAGGQLEIVQYFHNNKLSDLVHTSHSGDTPLHFACKSNHLEVVQFLLSTGKCDPLIENAEGLSSPEITTSPEIRKLLDHFCKGKYPLESVVKVFFLGDPMAGKSSLVQAIQSDSGFLSSLIGRFQKVKGVTQQTAGIDSFTHCSSEVGHVVIYDFAGQREFYTSHAAILQSYSSHIADIFIVVTNIALGEDHICQSLQYWVSFIQDCCTYNKMKPHVIFVGSHADQLDMGSVERALKVIEQGFSVHSESCHQFYETEAVVCLNCTQAASPQVNLFRYHLEESCNAIRKKTEKIDQCCYVLHKYIHKIYVNEGVSECGLKHFSEDLESNPYLLPSIPSELLPLLQTLHDKGQVILLKNDQDISNSWVITNFAALLETVVGSIFAPRDFPQHIAPGSTGIVPKSRISEAFPELNTDMVIGFLEHFEFCQRVEPNWLGETQSEHQMSDDEYYLFPALLTSENMPQVWQESDGSSYCCGWFMYSTVEGRFFTTRFLHALLLRLAFLFAPPQDDATPSGSKTKAPALSRSCNMWENGISWPDKNGVKAVFEVKDMKTATLRMMCMKGREIYCVRLRTKLIRAILNAKNEFCPHIHVEECIVEVPAGSQMLLECPSHSIKYLSTTIANRDPKDDPDLMLTHSDGTAGKQISELLYFEPYAVLTPDLITQLFAKEIAKKLVSNSFVTGLASCMYPFSESLEKALKPDPSVLSGKYKEGHQDSLGEISRQQLRCKYILEAWLEQQQPPATYKILQQELNGYSIFCGRNPLNLVRNE